MKLEDLKIVLDELYGFDICKKSRKRKFVYARKVFVKLAYGYGYTWEDMKEVIGMTHDLCIFHHNSFTSVKPIDLDKYNAAITYFDLPMDKISSMSWYINGEKLHKIVEKLKVLSVKDLKYFEYSRVDRFLEAIQEEKELKSLHHE
jgi:hypothetical protein